MTKKYKNSPLTEVVAEFSFIPDQAWNSTITGEVYLKVKEDFPVIKQRQDQILVAVPTEEKPQERVQLDFVELIQFWNESNTLLTQVGRDLLTVNALKPYPTWENFLPLILKTLDAYRQAGTPKGIKRANLRYINTIEIPKSAINFKGNFELPIPTPPGLEFPVRFINTHLEYELNSVDVLAQKFTSVPTPNSEVKNLVLQIEVVMNKFDGISIDDVEGWLDRSHKTIIEIFESTVSDSLKKSFE
jgi:uncharacterized protein (TIGR04255 family)